MARQLRIEYRDAIYHVMSRGDRKEAIFRIDEDRERFLTTLGEACEKTGWQVHAFCLMPNHFHLVVETPRGNLVAGMKWLLGTYTSRFNRRHGLTGHLFAGRYKSLVVDGHHGGYLQTVCSYVHLNPARATLLEERQPLRAYRWSSYPLYLSPPSVRPPWLRVDRVLAEEALPNDTPAARRAFDKRMEARRSGEDVAAYGSIRQGWCLGEEGFRQELLGHIRDHIGPNHFGRPRSEAESARAELLVQQELRRRRISADDLRTSAKGAAVKIRIAQKLRQETTASLAWIAARLHAGTVANLSFHLYRLRRQHAAIVNNRD